MGFWFLYFGCGLFFLYPIVSILLEENTHEDVYYLLFALFSFLAGLYLFQFFLHNLYFAFFASFFCVVFTILLFFHIKKERTFAVIWSIPYLILQIVLCLWLFFQFFQSF